MFRLAKLLRSLAAYGRERQEIAVVFYVPSAECPLTGYDKLAYVNFHVAAHHVQKQLPCSEYDTFEMFCVRTAMF